MTDCYSGPKTVNGESELCSLPDGTIISWLRIPTDPTSKAIAFVNHEIEDTGETSSSPTGSAADLRQVTWVSPGGWDPKSPNEAGVTYPCVALGTLDQIIELRTLFNPPMYATAEIMSTSTSPSARSQAVFAAINWCAGDDTKTGDMLAIAADIENWLTRPAIEPSPAPVEQDYPGDSITQAMFRQADELRHAITVLQDVRHEYGLPLTMSFIKRASELAEHITKRAQELL